VGLWITPAGYVLIYYFLPASVKNPIYSHKLSLVGFWSLALFYPFVGIHHYLYSPIADWAETLAIITSMPLIVPVWTVLQNFFGTMIGRWQGFGQNLPAKFLIMGSLMYLAGCCLWVGTSMACNESGACSHCRLPLGRFAQRREVHGAALEFCC
jgi:cytochrome c oxidase cbb3-type subunit I